MKMRLLVAEDDEQVRDCIYRTLRSTSVEIRFATNGADALAELRTGAFDFIISDVDMPTMNGIEFLRHVVREFPGLVKKFAFYTGRHKDDIQPWIDVDVPILDKFDFRGLRAIVSAV